MIGSNNRPEPSPLAVLLRRWMRARGLTQEQLSSQSQVPKATIHRWLTGKSSRPYYRRGLLDVAAVLGLSRVSTNRLLIAAGFQPLDLARRPSDPEEAELINRWMTSARNNLPAPLTSFVGRTEEVGDIAESLVRDEVRLLTLTGPGGSGKTRLSIQVARALLDVFTDGVFFVPLAPVSDARAVPRTIAETIGLRDVADLTLPQRLANWLRPRTVLLVLDNLEHVIDCGPDVVSLLAQSPHLTILATSRRALHVSAEYVHPIEPFAVPHPRSSAETLCANPAVTLFLQRAGQADASTVINTESLPAVAEICSRLDGLPLAIELAAGQLQRRRPEELLTAFPNRLGMASGGPRDVARRQQTLRDAIEWSVDLLEDPARDLFRELTVFVGGWTEEAAAAVTSRQDVSETRRLLNVLCDANLVERTIGAGEAARYHMLATIREYGLELRDAWADDAGLRDRHARHFLHLVESAPPYVPQKRIGSWYERVDADLDNIRAALEWVSKQPDDETFGRFAGGLWPYWHEYMRVAEGWHWLTLAESRSEHLPDPLKASILTGMCTLGIGQGKYEYGVRSGEAALALWRNLDDLRGCALVLKELGWMSYMLGRKEESIAQFEQALTCWREVGDASGLSYALSDLAVTLFSFGDFVAADPCLRESESICLNQQNDQGLIRVRRDRGLNALLRGDVEDAIALLEDSVSRIQARGRNYLLPAASLYLGVAFSLAGRLEEARDRLADSLALHEEIDDKMHISLTLLGLADVAQREGNGYRAAVLCGASHAMRASNGLSLPPAVERLYAQEVAAVIETIGAGPFDRGFADGADFTLPDAIAYARRTLAESTSRQK